MFPSEAEPLDLGSQAGAWKLILLFFSPGRRTLFA